MDNDSKPIDLQLLKTLIHKGTEAMAAGQTNKDNAVLVIGDTGVGKSTIMSFLAGDQLKIVTGTHLKPVLDNTSSTKKSQIRIGHQRLSETRVPTKVDIEGMAFYDCPGFKDNNSEEIQISNSFFVQRLLDMYRHVKIVLVVDQTHISEARADKMPKLIKNLHASFRTFDDIRDGVCLIINRAAPDHSIEDYNKQIRKIAKLRGENGPLFDPHQQQFLDFLMYKRRVLLFKQAGKTSSSFQAGDNEYGIMRCIKDMQYVRSKHIQNIISESAKLSIRDFIDQITTISNTKIEIICAQIIDIYSVKLQNLGRDIDGIMQLKTTIINLAEEIMASKKENIVDILQKELPKEKIQDFQEDFASIMFFKGIYDKTSVYFSNLTNKIYAQLTHLITHLDKKITHIQKEVEQEKEKIKEREETQKRQKAREEEKIIAMEHCDKMEELKMIAQKLSSNKKNLIEEIKASLRALGSVEDELRRVKVDAVNLKKMSKEIDSEFERIEVTFFQKRR